MVRVLFVCLGNICRSPMADGIFRHLVSEAGLADQFEIDSAGTSSYHVGEESHRGTRRVLAANGIQYSHRSRQVRGRELNDWDYLIAMDGSNLSNLERMADGFEGQMGLLLDYASGVGIREVPDPFYVGRFEEVFDLVEQGCRGLLAHIREKEGV